MNEQSTSYLPASGIEQTGTSATIRQIIGLRSGLYLAVDLTTFVCFGRLPHELRCQIWDEASDAPHVFILNSNPAYYHGFAENFNNPTLLPAMLMSEHGVSRSRLTAFRPKYKFSCKTCLKYHSVPTARCISSTQNDTITTRPV